MKFSHIAIFLAFILNINHSYCQDSPFLPSQKLFDAPMKHRQILAGSFAELRDAHFHSGIDFKTEQTEGKPIYAPADGYVSRISVARGGYGKALYINHPNGYTTVYGHISVYAPMIDSLIREQQYKNESYTADISLPEGALEVKKGTLVAWSGNTGGSGGPHLHFEIRSTADNTMLNPLSFGFDVKDHRSPTIKGIYILNTEGTDSTNLITHPRVVSFAQGSNNGKATALGKIGIAVDAYDTMDDAPNIDGIYSISLYVNGKKTYGAKMDSFPLNKTKEIDLHVLYDYYITHGKRLIKCYKDPQNTLPIYDTLCTTNAIIDVKDGDKYDIAIEVKDIAGNVSKRSFTIVGNENAIRELPAPTAKIHDDNAVLTFLSSKDNNIIYGVFDAFFPKGTFYKNTTMDFKAIDSLTYRINSSATAVAKPFTVSFDVSGMDSTKLSKTQIARPYYSKDGHKHYYILGGVVKDGRISIHTSSFGVFTLAQDVTPPTINKGNWVNGTKLKGKKMTIYICDNGSGLGTYKGYVDGKWVLMEYEYKRQELSLDTEKEGIKAGLHTFKLEVSDAVGNVSVFNGVFIK